MAQQHTQDALEDEDLAARHTRAVGHFAMTGLVGLVAAVTFATSSSIGSQAGRITLGAGLTVIFAVLGAISWTTRARPGWTRWGGPSGAALALVALAGLLHIAVTGMAAGTVLVACAVACAGYVLPGRRSLAVVTTGVWVLWATALGIALATGGAGVNGGPGTWTLAASGIVLATFPAQLTLLARDRELRAIARAQERAADAAVLDQLTGAANRQGLAMIARPMIENARRQGQAVHCLYVDLEDFRSVNERAGWEAGDRLLAAAAEALRGSTRLTDVVARWSADEFVVLGPGTGTSPLEMERRVRKRLTADCPVTTDIWTPRVSVGSSTLVPWDDGDLEDLTRRADEDMHLRRSLRRRTRAVGRSAAPDGAGHEGGTAPAVG